ncbi:uncharacterized protein LOC107272058 isoform X3 [Cephus cinctus]|uniref:Odorant receptor n=1 Tax=Cephus cinctus TaxID=211228 RepID=A0AAJ7FR74_CEPCN|nr:uncharacterized protein LOC107272058 isoform X3 [Cephus cinctus]
MTGKVILPKFDNYILLNKFGLRLLGLWPIPEDSAKWKFTLKKLHVSLVYVLLLSLLVPQLLDLYILWGDVDANVENLCTSLTTFTVLAKLTNIVASRGVFQKSLATMKENWDTIMRHDNCPEEREILLKMSKVGFVFTRNYCIIMYITAGMYFLRPLVVGSGTKSPHVKEYPFCAWYYYDQFSNLTYGIFYFSQVIIGFFCGTGNFTLDSLCLVMVYHACAQLRILQKQISQLTNDGSDDILIVERVRQLVKLHKKNIENARNLEAVFSGASAQQLLVSCVIICVIGLKLIVSLNDAFQLIMYVAYMQLVIFQIYLYCSPGDELINQVRIKKNSSPPQCEQHLHTVHR